MASIDDKVVAMSFENGKFESGAAQSLSTLAKLAAALKFTGGDKGLKDIEAAAGNTKLSGIQSALETLTSKFSALRVVGLAVLASIASKAVSAGASLVKSFTIGPITDGLKEYETNLNSVQTILANTQASGAKLKDVNAALSELNAYSDKTIYNFSEMARNIGTFTAAGVDLDTSVSAIKGISNLAALSGSNAQQAAGGMYQLSQAIASGKVGLEDYNSVVKAGFGGAVFQRALAQTAEAMGTLDKGTVKLDGSMKNVKINGESFIQSIRASPGKESWLTSGVLTNTLKQFTGDLTDAELKAMGFNDAQIRSIQATARTAMLAATEVKTLSAVFGVAKETAGSGWAQTFQIIFGDFEEAKSLFTGLSTTISGFIANQAAARNAMLQEWADLGGRQDVIEGLKAAFSALGGVLKPIHEAFRQIFPATTGAQLAELSSRFREFAEGLKIGPETANNLKRTFAGFFAVLSIGKTIIGGFFHILLDLLGAATSGSGGFLKFTAGIGDFLVSVDKALKSGDGFAKVIDTIGTALTIPINLIKALGSAFLGLFSGGGSTAGLSKSLSGIGDAVKPLKGLLDGASDAWRGFLDLLGSAGDVVGEALSSVGSALSNFGSTLADNIDFSTVFAGIQTGLVAGIALLIKRFVSDGININIGESLFGNISDSFEAVTGSLKAMQTSIQAGTLLKIAGAIALLTASIVALSFVKADKIQSSLSAMTAAFIQLLAAMAVLVKISGAAGFVRIPVVAASLILLAVAVDVLVLAVIALSRLSWDELLKGLAGVAGLLAAISLAAIPLSANSAGLVTAGAGMILIAGALKILASVVKDFGEMDWASIGRGLAGMYASLYGIGLAVNVFPKNVLAIGAGLILVAAGLKIIASAVKDFGSMDLKTLAVGIGGIAAVLVSMGLALKLFPKGLAAQAVGLVVVAVALQALGKAVADMGGMSMEQIGKGLLVMAGSLLILAVALNAMSGTLLGSASLAVAAAALIPLAVALRIMGSMSWESIAKGMIVLGGAFVILGAAGLLLAPVAPVLLALGAALLLLGAGIALIGVGILAVSAGFSALAVAGPAGLGIMVAAITAFIGLIPQFVIGFVNGLLTMVTAMAEKAPEFVAGIVKILTSMIDGIITLAPKIGQAAIVLIETMLNVIRTLIPEIVDTGLKVLMALLQGIYDNVPQIVTMVIKIVAKIIETLAGLFGQVVKAGADLLGKLISGIVSKLGDLVSTAGELVNRLTGGITGKLGDVVEAGVKMVGKIVAGMASKIGDVAEKGADIVGRAASGVAGKLGDMTEKGADIVGRVASGIASHVGELVSKGASMVSSAVSGAAGAVGDAVSIGSDIVSGVIRGIAGKLGEIAAAGANLVRKALAAARGAADSHSPSRVFRDEIGKNLALGVIVGMDGETSAVQHSASNMVNTIVDTMGNALSVVPSILDGLVDMDPVITPVLDLSKVTADAKTLNGLSNIIPIDASASFTQAAAISDAQQQAQTAQAEADSTAVAPMISLEQNNYSPESLSAAEIYRQTKNQLSQAQSLLEEVAS